MSNVAQIVRDNILQRLEDAERTGEIFHWVKPFSFDAPDTAYSYDTLQPYRGINRLLLDNSEFLTYNKIQELNKEKDSPQYQIRKGSHSHIVCYYNTRPIIDEETGKPKVDEFTGEELKQGFLKYYRVFSREDVIRKDNGDNLPSRFNFTHYSHEEISQQMQDAVDRFNRLFNYYCETHGITVEVVNDGTEAYFSSDMKIRVPHISNFESCYHWVHTLAHEMAHSTGVFLNRFSGQTTREEYSKEELVAEITAEIITKEMHIPFDEIAPDNSIAYIQSWSKYLKDNKPNEIISAGAKAEQAVALIMECLREMEHTAPEHTQMEQEEER